MVDELHVAHPLLFFCPVLQSYGKLKDLGVDIIAAELATADVASLLVRKKHHWADRGINADLSSGSRL